MRPKAVRSRIASYVCAIMLCLAVPVFVVTAAPSVAYAAFLSSSSVDYVDETSCSLTLQFSNNVAGNSAWSVNAGSVQLIDENGSAVDCTVSRNYFGNTPNDTPDPSGERQRLYVSATGLAPGTSYTLRGAGMINEAGVSVDPWTISFTTVGKKPQQGNPDEHEPQPEPVPPPLLGGGGQGGGGGTGVVGAGVDAGGSDGAAAVASNGVDDNPDAAVQESAAPAQKPVPVERGASLAAGQGGGKVYAVGGAGLDTGAATKKEPMPTQQLSSQTISAMGFLALGAAGCGMARRGLHWRRHRMAER